MLYQFAVYLHLMAAITWVGGTLFIVMVLVPFVRSNAHSRTEGARQLVKIGRRFVPVAWSSIALLVATGLFIAWNHWGLTPADIMTGQGRFVRLLQAKAGIVGVVIMLSVLHDFVLGPRLAQELEAAAEGPLTAEVQRPRRILVLLARANLLLALTILLLAVTLTRAD